MPLFSFFSGVASPEASCSMLSASISGRAGTKTKSKLSPCGTSSGVISSPSFLCSQNSLQTSCKLRFQNKCLASQITRLRWANVGLRWSVRLGQRWMPTLGQCHFAHRANVRPTCWVNVGPTLQVFFLQRFANVTPTYMVYYSQRKKSLRVKFGHRKPSYNLK